MNVSKKINKKRFTWGRLYTLYKDYTMHFLKVHKQSCHVIQHSTFLSSAVSDINFNMQSNKSAI